MKKTSKLLLSLMLAFVTVSGTACNSKPNYTSKEKDSGLKGSINIFSNSRDAEILKYAVENYTKLNPKVSINIKVNDKVNTGESLAGIQDSPDIFVVENKYAKHFIKSNPGQFMDLSGILNSNREKYPKWKLTNLSGGSGIYGCPWYSLPVVLYYRTDIFKAEGINPDDIKTWDDFADAGKKITKDTNKKVLQSISTAQFPLYKIFFSELNNRVVDKEGKLSFDTDKAMAALNVMKKLQDNGLISQYGSSSEFIQDIVSGNVACFIASADGVQLLTNEALKQKNLWSVMMLPSFEPGGNRTISEGGSSFFVYGNSKNKELASDFIKYAEEDVNLSSAEIEKEGIFPANQMLYGLKDLNIPNPYLSNAYFWKVMSSTERLSPEVYYADNYDEVNKLVESTVDEIMTKNADMKTTLTGLQNQLESMIK